MSQLQKSNYWDCVVVTLLAMTAKILFVIASKAKQSPYWILLQLPLITKLKSSIQQVCW